MDKVSVIIPTCNRYKTVIENVKNIRKQSCPTEIIVCDDSHIEDCNKNKDLVSELKNLVDGYYYTAIYDHDRNKLYGLGRARNRGIIECSREFIVFLDDRITPDTKDMIEIFIKKLHKLGEKNWVFGDKGAHKESFVENCSATRRKDIITSGMFPETINSYGFMTREVYGRHIRQGWTFTYVPEALAKPLCTGSRRNDEKREEQITYSKNKLRQMKMI